MNHLRSFFIPLSIIFSLLSTSCNTHETDEIPEDLGPVKRDCMRSDCNSIFLSDTIFESYPMSVLEINNQTFLGQKTTDSISISSDNKGYISIYFKNKINRNTLVNFESKDGKKTLKKISAGFLNTELNIKSRVTGIIKTIDTGYELNEFHIKIEDLKDFPAQLDTLDIFLDCNTRKISNDAVQLRHLDISLALLVPKIFRSSIYFDSTRLHEITKEIVREKLENPLPDVSVRSIIPNYSKSLFTKSKNEAMFLDATDFIFYHTGINSTLQIEVYDDDFSGSHDYFLQKQYKFSDLLSNDYISLKNQYIEHGGVKCILKSFENDVTKNEFSDHSF